MHRAIVLAPLLLLVAPGAVAQTPAPPTARIDHVAIHVRDVDASARFYVALFGLREIPSPVAGRRWFDLGYGVALHLLGVRSAPVADDRSVHLAITTADLAPVVAALKERGISYTDFAGRVGAIGSSRGDGVHQIFLRDPDGYWLEVNDALASRPPQTSKD
ncbi:VOC family protein [Sphingomonas sp. SUN019]|uniref:VOC family protein n=1 Tax=Sphingomonas sp. SUN019 TaxID=2937788 RepID=UPI0021649EBD|nr:VOC family protein [Sphingomonas sp. SUN019]UVO51495.1 VOC family protein [Sphingomonas sp. SUN019]